MFWPDDYLIRVARQIRVKRIRAPLVAELRDHMLCQKADYLAQGMDEAEAERKTCADMGDALLVGGALDAAHRPRTPWKGLLIAALLLALGLGFRLFGGALAGFSPARTTDRAGILLTLMALLPLCLFAFVDYTFWIRWSLPALWVWLGMVAHRLWIWVAFGNGPLNAEGLGFLLRSPLLPFLVPQVLAVGLPTLTALLACRLRGRGWGALALCLLPTLALALLCRRAPRPSFNAAGRRRNKGWAASK